jgi:hypothetical protein
MKTVKILLIGIAVIIIGTILVSFIIWLSYPVKKINLYILDKTVKDFSYREHKSLFWVLNNSKFVNSAGDEYNFKHDYYGFHPIPPLIDRGYDIKRISLEQIDSFANVYDGLYYADTYGVYFNEWYMGFRQNGRDNSLIEGALNQNDYLFLKAMVNLHKLVICEYNTLEAPTDDLLRVRTENLLGISTTGWIGKYFSSLDSSNDKIPKMYIKNYTSNNNGNWPFKNSGILIANNNGGIIVLESEKSLYSDKPIIIANEKNIKKYHIPDHINYTNWFEIINAGNSTETIAKYQLNVNAQGESLLNSNNLRSAFPAVIVNKANPTYYFAGNFANNNISIIPARMANSRKILRKFSFDDNHIFFYNFYFPLVESITNDYILTKMKH